MKPKTIQGVPEHYKGAHFDTESKRVLDSPILAVQQFKILKERFFNINHWQEYCGKMSAEFRLCDMHGFYVDRMPKVGDFFRIDIPGPGNPQTKGYDWVEIVAMDDRCFGDELERYLISCRPSKPPGSRGDNIAHFYSPEASSTFIISRGSNYIKVGIYGRNEVANFSRTGMIGKIRNALITIGGFLRATKFQWKGLAEGFLDF
jgi:hypothetical protein